VAKVDIHDIGLSRHLAVESYDLSLGRAIANVVGVLAVDIERFSERSKAIESRVTVGQTLCIRGR
jgi:hypothetical protein